MGIQPKHVASIEWHYGAVVLIAAWLSLAPNLAHAETPSATFPSEALLAGWEATYGSMDRHMEIDYTKKVIETTASGKFEGMDLSSVAQGSVRRLAEDGVRERAMLSYSAAGFDDPASLIGYSFDGKNTMLLNVGGKGEITPGMTTRVVANEFSDALRLGHYDDNVRSTNPSWVGKPKLLCELRDYASSGAVLPAVQVRPSLEQVGEEWCHVIERPSTAPGRPSIRMWMAARKQMLIMRYEEEYAGQKELMEVQELAKVATDVGDIWYPHQITITTRRGRGDNWFTITERLNVHKFLPYAQLRTEDFRLVFPEGTRVFDRVLNIAYTVTATGHTNVYDVATGSLGREGQPIDGSGSAIENVELQNLDKDYSTERPGAHKATGATSDASSSPARARLAQPSPSSTAWIRLALGVAGAGGVAIGSWVVFYLRAKTRRK